MLLLFHQRLTELRLTWQEYFALAYYAKFKRMPALNQDHHDYVVNGKLPIYVVEFLQQDQSCNKSTAPSAESKC